jgi:plastocyanin
MKQYRNLLRMDIYQIADGGLGDIVVDKPSRGFVGFEAVDDGLQFDITVIEGASREVFEAIYRHASRTLTRGTVLRSTAPGNMRLRFTRRATVQVVISAETMNEVLLQLSGGIPPAPVIQQQPASVTAAAGDTVVFSVFAVGIGLAYQWRRGGVNIDGARSSSYEFAATLQDNGAGFSVVVSNLGGTRTSEEAVLTIEGAAVPPQIVTQPISRTVDDGDSVTFAVVATGTAPLAYQWMRNGLPVPGAVAASWTFAAQLADDDAEIWVVVSNDVDEVESAHVGLTVNVVVPPVSTRARFAYGSATAGSGATVADFFASMQEVADAISDRSGRMVSSPGGNVYTWVAVRAAAITGSSTPAGVIFTHQESNSTGAFSGALSVGAYAGLDSNPTSEHLNFTDANGEAWWLFRSSLPNTSGTFILS